MEVIQEMWCGSAMITRRLASLCQLGGEVVFSYVFYSEMLSDTQCAVYKRTIHVKVYTFPCFKQNFVLLDLPSQ